MPGIDIFSTLIVMVVLLQDSLILVTSESPRRTLFAVFLRLWKTAFLSKKKRSTGSCWFDHSFYCYLSCSALLLSLSIEKGNIVIAIGREKGKIRDLWSIIYEEESWNGEFPAASRDGAWADFFAQLCGTGKLYVEKMRRIMSARSGDSHEFKWKSALCS